MPTAHRWIGNRRKIGLPLVVCALALLLAGCPQPGSPRPTTPEGAILEGTQLRVLVVDDPALAGAMERVEGEWNAISGSSYRVGQVSLDELDAAPSLDADVVIAAPCLIGEVQAKAEISPVPASRVTDDQGSWSDLFSLLRVREAVWGQEVVGVPLGSPVWVIYYRADLLEQLGRQPPQTWDEYLQLAERLSDRTQLGQAGPAEGAPWNGVIEPLGPGWAGLTLLARAAPYVHHRENYSTMFRIDSMEPLIDGPPFVRALEELVAATAWGPPEQLTYDPAAVRHAFWQGRCGVALTWPSGSGEPDASRASNAGEAPPAGEEARFADPRMSIGLAELPGSAEAYDVAEKAWEPRQAEGEEPRVPLLGTAGRMGLVPKSCPWPDAAFQLLFWLAEEQSTQVSPASPSTTLFRSSHVESPEPWVEKPMPPHVVAQYAEMTQVTLCRPQWLFALRIPGRRKYLAALDAAVHRAVRGEQSPQQALADAAQAWRKITDQLGLDRQREAYWNSLGLE